MLRAHDGCTPKRHARHNPTARRHRRPMLRAQVVPVHDVALQLTPRGGLRVLASLGISSTVAVNPMELMSRGMDVQPAMTHAFRRVRAPAQDVTGNTERVICARHRLTTPACCVICASQRRLKASPASRLALDASSVHHRGGRKPHPHQNWRALCRLCLTAAKG
jgi:hypothetical protein